MSDSEEWPGITNSYLYIGTRYSWFTFHVEDMNLNSISFNRRGASKVWDAIAEKDSDELEKLCKEQAKTAWNVCRLQ